MVVPPAPAPRLGLAPLDGAVFAVPFGVSVIVRSRGSIRIEPSCPCGADVSARPVKRKPVPPDSSIVPPSPD